MENYSKKSILYLITQSELGGAQRYVFDLANSLQGSFEVTVAFGEQAEKGELAKMLDGVGIKYCPIPHLKRSISPLNDFLALIQIVKLIKKIKPDIIHLNSSKISIIGSIAKLFLKIATFNSKFKIQNSKLIYTVHGWVFNEPLPFWLKLFYKYAEKFTAYFKNKIICVSEFDRQIALKEKIAPEKKLVAIRNGLDPINFLSKEEAKQKIFSLISPLLAKERAESEILIGSIGNLYKTKGFAYLVEATKNLLGLNINPITVVIGEGEERKNLEKLIEKNNLKNNFILLGRIDKAAQFLPAFDIYTCSSVKEGLSYTLIEAMQAGLPIVATQVGGNPELIKNKETGLLAKTKNPQELAEKIKDLINNPELKKSLGEKAKGKAMSEFSLEKMVSSTKRIYLE